MNVFSTQRLTTVAVIALCAGLVLYPLVFLLLVAGNTGDPLAWPPEQYGVGNLTALYQDPTILLNTLGVSALATVMAIVFGSAIAWMLTRVPVPGRGVLTQLMILPYYVTPLVGALAWAALGGPRSGIINQLWSTLGGTAPLVNIYSVAGIAWVMALFEGSVAFVMISAAMKSMDPALEEMSQVLGAGKVRTMWGITLPLLAPAILGATVFVFAEMLGSFSVPAILGMPERFFVVTTAIYTLILRFPPDYGTAAAMGLGLFVIMAVLMHVYGRITRSTSYVTITGKGFRPRLMAMGRFRWLLCAVCIVYVGLAVVVPIATLVFTSLLRFMTVVPKDMFWTFDNYQMALSSGSVRQAIGNSLLLAVYTASIGVPLTGLLSWIVYRTRLPGSHLVEYLVMFPASVPRMIFGLGLLLAWIVVPIPLYGTIWLLLIAYLTVFLPLSFRTISGVVLQLDRSLEECARVCGASWLYQLRTVTMPLLRPGLTAAWMLIFIASVREVGASVFLMGPQSKVIGPAIIASWETSGQQLTAAMALLQMLIVFVALTILLRVAGRLSRFEGE